MLSQFIRFYVVDEPKTLKSPTTKNKPFSSSSSHTSDEQRPSSKKYKKKKATPEELEKILAQNLSRKYITLPAKLPAILKAVNKVNLGHIRNRIIKVQLNGLK